MYITELTLDGFKSYATKITLNHFDPCFNAITGLNGSGKSNVLDSICFVMGISNMSHVRVDSLQGLVYKQGQAGITKATVSITFLNNDRHTSPTGYEDMEKITVTRQVQIGGRNKYMINGKTAQPKTVMDMFESVQLNVNNPHFLIMQGRVTKVCNMKPREILSMLEEACGVKMYEKKKETSLKIVESKDKKLQEIDELLDTELRPSLEKLKEQQKATYEFQILSSDVDRLRRFCLAYDWTMSCKEIEDRGNRLQQMNAGLQQLKADVQQKQEDITEKESEVKGLEAEKEIQAGGEMKELTKEVDNLLMQQTKDTTNLVNKQKDLQSEVSNLQQLQQSLEQLNEAGLQAAVEEATAHRAAMQERLEAAEHAVEAATREVAGAEAGDGRDESNKSMQERLEDARNDKTAAEGEAKAAEVKLKHLKKQAQQQQRELGSKQREGGSLQTELQNAEHALATITQRMEALNYDPESAAALQEQRDQMAAEVQRLRREVDDLSASISGVDFRYRDPVANFDRSKVKGTIAKLFKVKDPSHSLALEVAAGGKLYQVVVDSEETGSQLLERGQLKNRVTLVPLNKVQYSDISPAILQKAQELVGTRAVPALQLLEYSEEVSPAVKYAFGNVFICQDQADAKKLAFSRSVGVRCVTLEGDDFNPGGLLTGGSRNNRQAVLARLHNLKELEQQLQQNTAALAALQQQLDGQARTAAQYNKLKQEHELASHQVSLLRERLAMSESAQLEAALRATEEELAATEAALEAATAKAQEMVAKAKQLEKDMASMIKDKNKFVQAAKAKLQKAKTQLEAAKKEAKEAEKKLRESVAQHEAAGGERQELQQQMQTSQQTIQGLEQEVAVLTAQVQAAKDRHDAAAQRLQQMKARQAQCDHEIKAARDAVSFLKAELLEKEAAARKAQKEIQDAQEHIEQYKQYVEDLEQKHPWIPKEKHAFGHGEFDFSKRDVNKAQEELEAKEKRQEELKKRGGKQVQVVSHLEKAEKDYEDVVTKRNKVENDKALLMQTIQELDKKKDEALKVTWQKVNEYFGSIFSTLLPGTEAKLEPPEGCTYLDGLEMKVAFGGVWKQSLTELSGGQRSLLALSLVLALCKNKPAPLYILDEVDAALDLNHTQNIGRMIKQYFPQSQFLVVSLKEGMFNNANVIFRTKFVDGVSTITRTVSSSGSKQRESATATRPPLRENVRR